MKKNYCLLVLFTLLFCSHKSFAFSWQDLWLRADQQGEKAMAEGHPQQASQLFKSKEWQGSAYYKSGDYKNAVEAFKEENTSLANYNRGNALALLGNYQSAITAYNEVLQQDPNFEDAKYNRDLLKKLLKDQKQQNQSQQSSQPQQDESQQSSQQQQNQQQQPNPNQVESQQSTVQSDDKKQHSSNNKNQQAQNDESQSDQQDKGQKMPNAQDTAQQKTNSKQSAQQTKIEQATEQWLKRIPDDPGGLMRQKFLRDHKRYQMQQQDKV